MFYNKEPWLKKTAWILSQCENKKKISITPNILKDMKSYHILGIDFLYQSYKKQFKGAILNEEEGMNMQLQVAAFLNAMFHYAESKFLVLILAPDHYIVNWQYHLTVHGGLKVQIITPKTCPEDFDQENGLALVLAFSNINLCEYLVGYDYFSSCVIDEFDKIAFKLIIKKLQGCFNIGLTFRNFYYIPNQKLQWTMLNWSNSGCVGKLGEFYMIDSDNFANFRDNYRHWWFTLTWNLCDSLEKLPDEEQEYLKALSNWAAANQISAKFRLEKKRKQVIIIDEKTTDSEQKKRVRKTCNMEYISQSEVEEENSTLNDEVVKQLKSITQTNSQTSLDILDIKKAKHPNYVQLPSMDENPILNSIIRNLKKSPEPILTQHSSSAYTAINIGGPTYSKVFDEENILLSIINDRTPVDSTSDKEEMTLNLQKEEIRSQIFSDEPCTSKSFSEDDCNLFQTLISDIPMNKNKSDDATARKKDNNIESILRDTEVLLNE